MRRIALVGSGQGGLQLGIGLLAHGYEVTLYSDRTADQWLNHSRPNGTAFLFDRAVQYERDLGLNFWEEAAPYGEGIHLTFLPEVGKILFTMQGRLHKPGQAIDQRLKFSRWLQEFAKRGGTLVIRTVTRDDLESITTANDLTIIAAGKGEITAQLFARDAERSLYDTPQRNLALVTVTGTKPWPHLPFHPIKFTFIAPVGEMFWVPFFDKSQVACYSIVFEAKPGGPMDRFGAVKSGGEAVEIAKQVIRDLSPWDYEHAKDMVLTDELAWLTGRFAPTVRQPVGRLPSGRVVMALGDTAITYDPIAAQGANNAAKMANHVLRRILAQGDRQFDAEWMTDVCEEHWEKDAKYMYAFTSALLEPIPPAAAEVLMAGAKTPAVAEAFFSNFNNPRDYWPWLVDINEARRWIADKMNAASPTSATSASQTE
jgi:2-polyprenyl-6-methoxyphenol hydroxylase-like FAD-dependent oxidoreductase